MLDTFLHISLLLFSTTTFSNFQYIPIVTRFIEEMSHVFQCVPPTTYHLWKVFSLMGNNS